ncbi:MAG: endonuclease domain-containing protein [bacterium]
MQIYYKKNKKQLNKKAKIWAQNNRTRKTVGTRKWRRNHKLNVRQHNLKYRYNLSLKQYNTMLILQDNRCALCRKDKKLVVDHNHKTGKVRALLCQLCNYVISIFDSKELHKKFLMYVGQENNS